MKATQGFKNSGFFERFSNYVTQATGSTRAFMIALLLVVIWACTGPYFHFSETWQLVINT
ncbi:MAG: low affinity iron permease family protein, partial [Chitinophagaceae bacterium]